MGDVFFGLIHRAPSGPSPVLALHGHRPDRLVDLHRRSQAELSSAGAPFFGRDQDGARRAGGDTVDRRGGGALQDFDGLYILGVDRSEEHTSELQSQSNLVCRLLLEKKKKTTDDLTIRSIPCMNPIPHHVILPPN